MNWTSGIEIGIRLISFVWIRRLLDGWPGVPDLFEENDLAVAQIAWHQEYLANSDSRGSSANNHVIAEAAGQLVASCAFPWFAESARWRDESSSLLERELHLNTFPSGLNREQASDYHGFVTELGLVAAVEAEASGHPLEPNHVGAAGPDARRRGGGSRRHSCSPPRQGDSDDGRALVLDAPGVEALRRCCSQPERHWSGRPPWWPRGRARGHEHPPRLVVPWPTAGDKGQVRSTRQSHFPDAGLTLLRRAPGAEPEIWCRCDGGPHGLPVHRGSRPRRRAFGRGPARRRRASWSTRARTATTANPITGATSGRRSHTTPSSSGPATSRSRVARSCGSGMPGRAGSRWTRTNPEMSGDGPPSTTATMSLDPPALHRRTVSLDEVARRIEIEISSRRPAGTRCRSALHLGPEVTCRLEGKRAALSWNAEIRCGADWSATLELDQGLSWSVHRGETNPLLGWYSSSFGTIEPTTVLMGEGRLQSRKAPCCIRLSRSRERAEKACSSARVVWSSDYTRARVARPLPPTVLAAVVTADLGRP